jgi:hypothetical protein
VTESEKTYVFERVEGEEESEVLCTVIVGQQKYQLARANRVSPCGFECGYGGGGPHGLAFEVLADFLWGIGSDSLRNDQFSKTWKLLHPFVGRFIVPMRLSLGQITSISSAEISRWIAETEGTPAVPSPVV